MSLNNETKQPLIIMKSMTKEEKLKVKKYKQEIKDEIPFVDIREYSHNFISLTLMMIERLAGQEVCNHLIRTTDLKHLGWSEVETKKK